MVILEEVKNLFEKQPLLAFATADKKGCPNVVPIYWKKITAPDKILLIDNYMDMSKTNIEQNPAVCLGFWDPDSDESYKIKGLASYHTDDEVYQQGKQVMAEKRPGANPKGVVEITVTEIYNTKPGADAGKKL